MGADLRLDLGWNPSGGGLSDAQVAAARDVAGVAALATVADAGTVTLRQGRGQQVVHLRVVDGAALAAVQAGLPEGLTDLTSGGTSAVATPGLPSGAVTLDAPLGRLALTARTVDDVPGVTTGAQWLVIDRATWAAVGGTPPVDRLLVRLDPGADPDTVAAAITTATGATLLVTTRAKAVGQIADSVLVRGVRAGMLAVAAAGLVLVAVVLGLMLVAEAPSRGRTAALLATVGAPGRVHRRLVVSEVLGPVLVGGAAGVLAGAVLPWAVLRLVDLRPFTGRVRAARRSPSTRCCSPARPAASCWSWRSASALAVATATAWVSRRRAQGRSGRMTTMTAPEIRCEDLVRIFTAEGVEVQALQGLNLNVEAGDLVALVGASGSGKSTLLTILSGLDRPRPAARRWPGTTWSRCPPASARSSGATPWGSSGSRPHGTCCPTCPPWRTSSCRWCSPTTGVRGTSGASGRWSCSTCSASGHVADHRPAQLSGGEQQRVAIATAVSNAPRVLLADEPTGELDEETSADVLDAIRQVTAELAMTTLIVTHDPTVAGHVRRTIRIRDGRTATETLRRTPVDEHGQESHQHEEFAVIDRVGRLQLPREFVEALELRDRVRLGLEPDHVRVWPHGEHPEPTAEDER